MKKLFVVIFVISFTLSAQDLPVAGKNFALKYDHSAKGIFNQESKLTLIYVFDYWGTKETYFGGKEGLFKNVLSPDEGRQKSVEIKIQNDYFIAEIQIPKDAQLLSYYITDGKNFDYNDNKTYVSYIYDENGNPVKRARFRNVDFLIMAGAEPEEYISEIQKELESFPDDHLVRSVYWSKKLESQTDFNSVISMKDDFEKEYSELKKQYGNVPELLDAEARTYYSFQNALSNIVNPPYQYSLNKIFELAEQIPENKRSSVINQLYQMLLRQKRSESFTEEIIGKPEIDFEFISIKGDNKKLSDYKGKVVMLDFWGTWCGPCVSEIPNLVKVYEKYKGKGFEIISISSDGFFGNLTEDEFKKFVEEKNMTWTQVLDSKDQTIHKLYNISHWPTLYLIDKNGIIVKNENVLRGEMLETTLEEVLNSN
ncbi:MAG: TlpA family protein disulfide reductase [Ignavibacteriales bacterium]|nr:TlpA family protein disulfide reductase [Ignavibacteriales bacterium]